MTVELVLVLLAYLAGSVPSALLIVQRATGRDVRREGSGNVGATNALRVGGLKAGAIVTLLDVGKGVLAVWAMSATTPDSAWRAAAAAAAVLGHCYPVWLRFRGGKGVATGLGAYLVLAPKAAVAALVVWLLVLAVGRWVSLASMVATALFPVFAGWLTSAPRVIVLTVAGLAAISVLRHRDNIRNLLAGTEPRIDRWVGR